MLYKKYSSNQWIVEYHFKPQEMSNYDQEKLNDQHIYTIFKSVDLNGNGRVSVGELLIFLRKLGLVIDQLKCFQILDQYDLAQDDEELDPQEFNHFFRATFPDKVVNPLPTKIALPTQPLYTKLLTPQNIDKFKTTKQIRK